MRELRVKIAMWFLRNYDTLIFVADDEKGVGAVDIADPNDADAICHTIKEGISNHTTIRAILLEVVAHYLSENKEERNEFARKIYLTD